MTYVEVDTEGMSQPGEVRTMDHHLPVRRFPGADVGEVQGAHVEIIDPSPGEGLPLIPKRVLVNGQDVGYLAEDGVHVEPGGRNAGATTVTLVLLPARVTIRAAEASDDAATKR